MKIKVIKPVIKSAKTTTKPVLPKLVIPKKLETGIFRFSGHRGEVLRQAQYFTDAKGILHLRATQERDSKAGTFKAVLNAPFAEIVKGCLVGDKQAKLQLGAYVDGSPKCNTAKARLMSPRELNALPKAKVRFQQSEMGYECRYLGNPNQRVVLGVAITVKGQTYYWQAECDRNAHNKHERTTFEPLAGEKLVNSK